MKNFTKTNRHTSESLIFALGNVGVVQSHTLYKIISHDRITVLKKANMIKKVKGLYTTYQLTQKGIEIWLNMTGHNFNCLYYPHKANEEHDLRLSEYYFSLSMAEQESWKTERYISKNYETIEGNSLDGMYQSGKEIIAVESIGKSYTQKRIEIKKQIFKKLPADKLVLIHC